MIGIPASIFNRSDLNNRSDCRMTEQKGSIAWVLGITRKPAKQPWTGSAQTHFTWEKSRFLIPFSSCDFAMFNFTLLKFHPNLALLVKISWSNPCEVINTMLLNIIKYSEMKVGKTLVFFFFSRINYQSTSRGRKINLYSKVYSTWSMEFIFEKLLCTLNLTKMWLK